MRIIYDGDKIYLNGYDIYMKGISKVIKLNDYKQLCSESFLVNKLVKIENKTLINNVDGTIFKHGLVRINTDKGIIDLTLTHSKPQFELKENKFTAYLHLSKNSENCVVNSLFKDRFISNRIYNLILVSDIYKNPNTLYYINTLYGKSFIEKIASNKIILEDHYNFKEKFNYCLLYTSDAADEG
jgi:hypothetical protein